MRILSLLLSALLLMALLPAAPSARADVDLSLFEMTAEIAAFNIDSESHLRSCGHTAGLNNLGAGEFYTYVLTLRYTGSSPIPMENMTVSVDGGERWGWSNHTLQPDAVCRYHIYYSNMKTRMTEGAHTVTWYLGNQVLMTKSFTFVSEVDWNSAFPIPSEAEIAACNQTATARSPYLYGYLQISDSLRFSEYSIDFKADTLPKATYICLANMRMDLSPLRKIYSSVSTEYELVNMYAGFQRRWTDTVSILSFWDIYCTDASGNQKTLRAQRLYPASSAGSDDFSGEGTGAHTLVPYEWHADHWYRMLLQCIQSEETGTTLVEQWVLDLETGVWTLLCRYDTLIPDSCFTGPTAFFLENFDTAYAGDVRTMEVANIRLFDIDAGCWKSVSSAFLASNGGRPQYEGSYAYGSEGSRFWMITSGVGGDWYEQGRVPQNQVLYVEPAPAECPY